MSVLLKQKQRINSDRVVMQDWNRFHPVGSPTDSYYVNVCSKALKILLPLKDELTSNEQAIQLAGIFGAYFEDVISETRIFLSFTEQHKKLYGNHLPFYDTAEEYYPDEINLYDLYFLAWHFLTITSGEEMIDPFFRDRRPLVTAVEKIYELFDGEFEQAPQNENMQAFFRLSPSAGIEEIRLRLDFLLCKSYLNILTHDIFMNEFMENMEDVLRETPEEDFEETMESHNVYFYDTFVEELFNRSSPVLALRANEELACILGESSPLYPLISNISKRKFGGFIFREEKGEEYIFEHTHSGIRLPVTKEFTEISDYKLTPGEIGFLMGLVKWGNIWAQMGIAVGKTSVDELYNYSEDTHLFDDPEEKQQSLNQMYSSFLTENQGKPVVYLKGKQTFLDWIGRWLEADMRAADKRMGAARIKKLKEQFLAGLSPDIMQEDECVSLFFNPQAGMEVYTFITLHIADPDNPYYQPTGNYSLEELIRDESCSKEFIYYLIENKLIEFSLTGPSGIETSLLEDNLDFLLRYFKKGAYWTEPHVQLTNTKSQTGQNQAGEPV
ncbi:MAG: DUF3843 family protein [Tannerella sp.]|jgi:hypothetical protein|nr:DUF3843 family protein [Tannerella sp.]